MKSVLKALVICGAGGVLFSAVRAPLPWMLGPLLAMAFGKFLGADLASPKGGRATGQLIIGCALGLYFTPVVGHEVVVHWYLLIAAAVFALLLAYASGWFLTRSTGLDGTTALFVVPFLFTLLGVQGVDDYRPAQFGVEASGLLALLVLAATAGALLAKLSVPNAWMLGPLAVAVALTLAEVGLSAIPVWLSNSAQLLLGCALGSGFDRKSLSTAPRFVSMVCASVVLAVLVSALFAWGLALAGTVPISTMVLATAPGGMAEMCVTAKVLQLGVPLVTAAHVTRVIILVTTTAPIFRFAKHVRRNWRA